VAYEKALDLNPKYAAAWNNLGIARKAKGDLDGAIAAYEKALELNPKHAVAWKNLGILFDLNLKQYSEALFCYIRASELGDKKSKGWMDSLKVRRVKPRNPFGK